MVARRKKVLAPALAPARLRGDELERLRSEYEAHVGQIKNLAAAWQLAPMALGRLARQLGWQRIAMQEADNARNARETDEMAKRIMKTLERQLADIERRIAARSKIKGHAGDSSAGHERDARTLVSLTRTLERMTGFIETRQKQVKTHEQPRDVREALVRKLDRVTAGRKSPGVSGSADK